MIPQVNPQERPDLTAAHDEQFDLKFARYAVGAGMNTGWSDFVKNMDINAHFFFDDQWIFEEDKKAFFLDDDSNSRNRIKVVKNFIKPIVTQYLGNARIMDLQFEAKPISERSINRREEALQEALFYTNVAKVATPELKQQLKNKFPIGNNEQETTQIFENTWTDEYTEAMNAYLRKVVSDNDFEEMRVDMAFDLALSGMCAAEYQIHNGEFMWEKLSPDEVFYDRKCKDYDFQDAEFIGRVKFYTVSEIIELWPNLTDEDRRNLKEASSKLQHELGNNGRIQVYTVYYRTNEKIHYGYVRDEQEIYAARLDDPSDDDTPTMKDLVPVSELNDTQLAIFGGSNHKVIEPEVIRKVIFIPQEVLPAHVQKLGNDYNDMVLERGVFEYPDTEYYRPIQADFPIKISAWMRYKDYIDTPISSLVNPQRMVNRFESVKEQRVNSHMGEATFIDEFAVNASDTDPDEIMTNMYQGKPSIINTRGKGLHNVVANVGKNLGNEVTVYNILKEDTKNDMSQIVGVNESLRGENQGQNKLVGVMTQEIQRASLIQEPFYGALARVFKQMYQATANVGKRVAIKNQHRLVIDVGDHNARVLTLSDDMNLEDFRVHLRRVADRERRTEANNELLLLLREQQMLTEAQVGDLFNRATMEDIARAVREKAKADIIASKQIAEQQQQQIEQQQINEQAAVEAEREERNADRLLKNKQETERLRTQERVALINNQKQ